MIYSYKNCQPEIAEGCFIAPSAEVIGRVFLQQNSNIWFNCLLRGDINEIRIGKNSNIQDLSVLHVERDNALVIGANVTVGHRAVLHACTIEEGCLIGIGAIVLDGAVIGKNSVVAAGSVVPPNKKYPAGSMILGVPAKVIKPLTAKEIDQYSRHYLRYIDEKNNYLNTASFKMV